MYLEAIILFALSGAIAYFGDLLGRKMGKKRLSLFGLRPKSTAIVMTVLTGMLISILVFSIFFAMSKDFRKVFIEGEQILYQNNKLAENNKSLEEKNNDLLKKSSNLISILKMRKKEVENAKKNEKKAALDLSKAKQSVTSLKREISKRQQDLAALKQKTRAAETEIALKEKELKQTKAEYINAQNTLKATKVRLQTAVATVADTEYQFNQKNKELQSVIEQLAKVSKELSQKEEALEEAKKAVFRMSFESALQRSKTFAVTQGDEMARRTIAKGLSAFEIRAEIYKLLDSASEASIEKGAATGENDRAATLVYREEDPVKNYSVLVVDQEDVVIDMVTATIQSRRENVMVQAVAAVNTFPDESVPVELKLYLDYPIYTKGMTLTTTYIDGTKSDGQILIALINFIQNKLQSTTRKAGVVPIANQNYAINFSTLPEKQVIVLLDLVDTIKTANKKVEVAAVANKTIDVSSSIDLSNIRIDINDSDLD